MTKVMIMGYSGQLRRLLRRLMVDPRLMSMLQRGINRAEQTIRMRVNKILRIKMMM